MVILLLFEDEVMTFTKISLYLIYVNKCEDTVENNPNFIFVLYTNVLFFVINVNYFFNIFN